MIESARVGVAPQLRRIVVAVDPALTSDASSDETGVAVAGVGIDNEYYVLESAGYRLSPDGWARKVIDLYDGYAADRVVAERNAGGEMVAAERTTLHQSSKT